ncbi:hypothetical protein C8R43DRAFT_1205577 [Mycena crocata]|nr:hypothetical protein C8R43DRAFT_1205577 [Mycena crocata]
MPTCASTSPAAEGESTMTSYPPASIMVSTILDHDCITEICAHILTGEHVLTPDEMESSYVTFSGKPLRKRWRIHQLDHRNILALALTSKQFMNPALDVMWKEIDSLVRILRVLPSFAFRMEDHRYVFGEPTPASWVRFDYYARKVRKLVSTTSIARCVDGLASCTVTHCFPTSAIAHTTAQPPADVQVVQFDVQVTNADTPQINTICFGWVHLPGESSYMGHNIRTTTAGFARSLPQVTSIDLAASKGGFHVGDLRMLASLPCLTSVIVWIEGPGWPDLLETPSEIFPALHTLKLGDSPRALIPRFLEKIGSTTLTTLTIFSFRPYSGTRDPIPLVQPALDVLGEKWPRTLRTLCMDFADAALTAPGLESLPKLVSLRHLRFERHICPIVTDTQFLALIRPLSNLISFSAFNWRGLTINALRHVANHLPLLKSVALTFNPPTGPPEPGVKSTSHPLTTLIVNATVDSGPFLRNTEATVCHLHHIFPSLRHIDIPHIKERRNNSELKEGWQMVEKLLQEGCPCFG